MLMKRVGILALSLISLLVGVLIGAIFATDYWMIQNARDSLVSAEVSLSSELSALKHLRAGRYERAIETLETAVDLHVLISGGVRKENDSLADEFSGLPEVADYRASVEYTSDDERVARILKAATGRHLTPQSSGTPR